MKKIKRTISILILGVLLAGCSLTNKDDGANNLIVNKDGTVICRIREDFDSANYDANELKSMIIQEAASYNSKHTSGAVLANKVDVIEGKTDVELKFASGTDYANFDSMVFYSGSVDKALESGYPLSVILSEVNNQSMTIAESDIKNMTSENILITEYENTIYLPSKAIYISDNAIVSEDSKTVHLDPAVGGIMYIIYK